MPSSPEQLEYFRLLRLRGSLTQAQIMLEEAVGEIVISDDFASQVLAAELDAKKALSTVVSLVKVHKDEMGRGVK